MKDTTWITVQLAAYSHFTVRIGWHRPRDGAADDRMDMLVTLTEAELRKLHQACGKAIAALDEDRSDAGLQPGNGKEDR